MTVRRQIGALGATLRTAPTADAPVLARLPAGTIIEGEFAEGEELYGDARFLRLAPLYVWCGRTVEPEDERAPARRKSTRKM